MRHVDEGILNAYLDGELEAQGAGSGERGAGTLGERGTELLGERETLGEKGKGKGERFSRTEIEAHLSVCEQCAALLQEVERVRDRASDILASSTPAGLEVPPFDEIRARAEARGQSQRVMQMGKVRKFAWAATVVLAVAVGWYARGTIIPGTTDQFGAPQPTTVAAAPEEGAGSGERGAEDEASTLVSNALEEATAPAVRRQPRGVEGDVAEREAVVETQLPAEQPAAKATEAAPDRSKAEPVLGVRADEIVDVSRERKGLADTAERPSPAAPRVVVQQVAADEPSPLVGGIAVGEALMFEDSLWVEATEDDARDILGGEVPTVTDLPVIGYSVSLLRGRNVVRVRQRLDDDEVLELVVGRAVSADRMQVAPRSEVAANEPKDADEAAVNAVTLQVGEYQVVLRGGVSRDSLRVLGGKVGG